jgi:hypothetical protein
MHQPDLTETGRLISYTPEPGFHLRSIRMRAVAIDDLHASMKGYILPEDLKNRLSLDNPASKCVLRLETHD